MKAAIYLRVSTERQDVANQRPELLAIARARGLEVVAEYDETQSAAKRRPVFDGMLEDARRGRFQVLIVWALDRFGRSMVDNVRDALELDRLGVQLVSARESWLDTSGPVRKLLIAIFSWIAEQERERLVERTRAGMARAAAAGRIGGRPRRMTSQQLDAALRMAAEGRSVRRIAVALKVPRATLQDALKRAPSGKGCPVNASETPRARRGEPPRPENGPSPARRTRWTS